MKQIIISLVLVLASSFYLRAQYNGPVSGNFSRPTNPPRSAWIQFNNDSDISTGFIRSLTDSTLLFATKRSVLRDVQKIHPEAQILSYKDIEVLQVHRAGSTWKGMGIGAATGAILGAIIGDLVAHPTTVTVGEMWGVPLQETITRQDYVQSGAILGTLTGILVGTIVGTAAHKKFVIQGKIERFREMQKKAKLIP